MESKPEPESIQFRDEQISAPAPAVESSTIDRQTGIGSSKGSEQISAEVAAGADTPKEPMNEKDVDYKYLEEMTAQADGKDHAPEEGSS